MKRTLEEAFPVWQGLPRMPSSTKQWPSCTPIRQRQHLRLPTRVPTEDRVFVWQAGRRSSERVKKQERQMEFCKILL